jgi:hypothetical protein
VFPAHGGVTGDFEMLSPQIYDPRRGQDFRINTATGMFSSLEHNFYVSDTYDSDWDNRLDLLNKCISKTSKLGFFTIAPWVPGAEKHRTRIKQEFKSVSECGGNLAGYFGLESDAVRRLFAIRKEYGEGKSGEWGIGGCSEKFDPPTQTAPAKKEAGEFFHLLTQPSKIGCLLYLGEMQQTTFMVRMFDGIDSYVAEIQSLGSAPSVAQEMNMVVTTENQIGDILNLVHDYWFNGEQIIFDVERNAVALRLERKRANLAKSSEDGFRLVIKNAEALTVNDTEKVRDYDLNEIKYDSAAGRVIINGGIPITIEIKVSSLELVLSRTI